MRSFQSNISGEKENMFVYDTVYSFVVPFNMDVVLDLPQHIYTVTCARVQV